MITKAGTALQLEMASVIGAETRKLERSMKNAELAPIIATLKQKHPEATPDDLWLLLTSLVSVYFDEMEKHLMIAMLLQLKAKEETEKPESTDEEGV